MPLKMKNTTPSRNSVRIEEKVLGHLVDRNFILIVNNDHLATVCVIWLNISNYDTRSMSCLVQLWRHLIY